MSQKEKKREKSSLWAAAAGSLTTAALLLRFLTRGYAYVGYTLLFIALLIVLHRFLPASLWNIVVILVCVGLIYFVAVERPILENARTDRDAQRPYLVVLGAAVNGDSPSLTLVHRLEGAMDYLEAYPESLVIVSGGKGSGENITEAQCMHDWLVQHGLSEERIILEDRATSTIENLQFSYEIIRARGDEPQGNVAIVSSPYHLYRAKLMSRSLGVEAAGVTAHWDFVGVSINYFIREAFGVTHWWVLGS